MDLKKQLEKLGLVDKEAKVYLALLELGQSTAQDTATKSGLNRATTYVILEALIKKNLVKTLTRNHKSYFAVENPLQIIDLLYKEQKDAAEKIEVAKTIMPELEMLNRLTTSKTKVKFFEGADGVVMIRKGFFKDKPKMVEEIFNINNALKHFPSLPKDHRSISERKKIKFKTITIYDPSKPIPKLPLLYKEERKYLPKNKFPFNADFTFYKNKTILISVNENIMGVVIENKEITEAMRSLFNLAWVGAEKYAGINKNNK
jgi:HTH-type transcriptional regulator, sugar sensing transcriptional regulator